MVSTANLDTNRSDGFYDEQFFLPLPENSLNTVATDLGSNRSYGEVTSPNLFWIAPFASYSLR